VQMEGGGRGLSSCMMRSDMQRTLRTRWQRATQVAGHRARAWTDRSPFWDDAPSIRWQGQRVGTILPRCRDDNDD
jgi:hypothetical protein